MHVLVPDRRADALQSAVMALVALPVAVADAHPDVIAAAGFVTTRPGGAGAVREVCDLLIDGRA